MLRTIRTPHTTLYQIDLGQRAAPDRAAWALFNTLRSSPDCLLDGVSTPEALASNRPAYPTDHRLGECVIANTQHPPAHTIQSCVLASRQHPGSRLHI